jgi:hypothetical protein
MKRSFVTALIEKTREIIGKCYENPKLRSKETAFTRDRELIPERLLQMILHKIYKPLQLEVDECFKVWHRSTSITKQAFSKARMNVNPEMVREFADMTSETLSKDDEMPTYKGMRIIAIDGSDVALENSNELKREFGCSGARKDAATALISLAFCPANHVIYDCRIDKYEKDERDLAKAHVERLTELGFRGSLLLFDRWYPSAEFIAHLKDSGYEFVMRVRGKWNLEVDAVETQKWVVIYHEGRDYRVRVLKLVLPTGEIETLLTSLSQKQLPITDAGEIYFKRWAIEVEYDLLKSKLQLENFSGKTKVSVLQDFYATIYLGNITAACAAVADADIAEADAGKELKYERRANRNRTVAKLRGVFLSVLAERNKCRRDELLDELIATIVRFPLSITPDKLSPDHKSPRKKRFHMNRKAVV